MHTGWQIVRPNKVGILQQYYHLFREVKMVQHLQRPPDIKPTQFQRRLSWSATLARHKTNMGSTSLLVQSWCTVCDDGPTLTQHRFNIWDLPGCGITIQIEGQMRN